MFEDRRMLEDALRWVHARTEQRARPGPVGQGRAVEAWDVDPALAALLPGGLRRGSSLSVAGSLSLLLAVLGAPSSAGAWCALVGMPQVSAEAAAQHGLELARMPVVDDPGPRWAGLVGALLDTVDVVVARPPARVAPGDVQRLAARSRARGSVLVAYLDAVSGASTSTHGQTSAWPSAEVHLAVRDSVWEGAGAGSGRLTRRGLTVMATGRGRAARAVTITVDLPTRTGGIDRVDRVEVADVRVLSRTG
jgi:hypothetical protein